MTNKWAWAVVILTLAFAVSPLASDGFGGFTRDQFPVVLDHWPAQPAGWAFAIWGLIYLWLIAGGLIGLRRHGAGWQAMRPPLALSLAVGVFWIAVANVAPVAATAMILVMAGGAIAALIRAGRADPMWLAGPVGLYAGWLTAASGVALAVVSAGHGLAGPMPAALVCLALVLVVGLWVQTRAPHALAYPAAICWALIGVIAANLDAAHWPVAALAGIGIVALAGRAMVLRRA